MLNIFKYRRGRKYMTGPTKTRPTWLTRKHSKRPKWKKRRKKNRRVIQQRIQAKRFKREVKRRRRRKALRHHDLQKSLFGGSYARGALPF